MHITYKMKNGMCLVCENMPYAKSVSVGIWVKAGTMYETKNENGISHFIEHMLFKGTTKRSAAQIAEEMDCIGGNINACTSREYTCYYTKTLAENIASALDILSDMYYNSVFDEKELELERSVITEEINMYEDSPEDVAVDSLTELMWKGNPLGYPEAGTVKSVSKISRSMIIDYFVRRYTPENTVISIAGCIEPPFAEELCEKYFYKTGRSEKTALTAPAFHSGRWEREKDIEQAHLAMAFPSVDLFSDRVYDVSVLNNIFGGSMSSRLFQSIREKEGLCYSIYSYTAAYPRAGVFGIYAGLGVDGVEKALDMIEREIHSVCSKRVSEYELKKAQSQLRCAILMGSESVSARMDSNGKAQLLLGKVRTIDETIEKLGMVTADSVCETANMIFSSGERAEFILNKRM